MKKHHLLKNILPALFLNCALITAGGTTAMAEESTQTDSAEATVMQLMKTEGDVEISNSSGKNISLISNMKLYNGYHAETEEASYAWINLDSEKLTKLDAVSEAEIRKSGKKLELLLNSGNLFFNVTKELEEDETMNVRTSTMVMGVRGTCGWVKSIDKWHSQVYILEGKVQCHVTDPVTGQVKEITLSSGESAEFYAYPQDRAGDKCDIITKEFTEDDIDGFALVELVQDVPLCEEIQEASGLDVLELADEAQKRLEEDEAGMRQIMADIKEKEAAQEHHISKDPVWEGRDSTAGIFGNNMRNDGGNLYPGTAGMGGSGVSAGSGTEQDSTSVPTVSGQDSSSGTESGSKNDSDSSKRPVNKPVEDKPAEEKPKPPEEVKPDPPEDEEPVPEDINKKARQAYQKVLDEYTAVSGITQEEYFADISRYPYVAERMMFQYYAFDMQSYYMYHDVNGDGLEEMIVGMRGLGETYVAALYTYDKVNDVAILAVQAEERAPLYIESDGTVLQHFSSGALAGGNTFYEISEDGYSLDTVFMYHYEHENNDVNGEIYYFNENGTLTAEECEGRLNALVEITYEWIPLAGQQNPDNSTEESTSETGYTRN